MLRDVAQRHQVLGGLIRQEFAHLQRLLQPPAAHDPFTHVEPAAQGIPQPPQLLLSVCSLTQAPLQSAVPLSHAKVHALLTHLAVA